MTWFLAATPQANRLISRLHSYYGDLLSNNSLPLCSCLSLYLVRFPIPIMNGSGDGRLAGRQLWSDPIQPPKILHRPGYFLGCRILPLAVPALAATTAPTSVSPHGLRLLPVSAYGPPRASVDAIAPGVASFRRSDLSTDVYEDVVSHEEMLFAGSPARLVRALCCLLFPYFEKFAPKNA